MLHLYLFFSSLETMLTFQVLLITAENLHLLKNCNPVFIQCSLSCMGLVCEEIEDVPSKVTSLIGILEGSSS